MAMVRFGDVAERVNTKEDRFKTDLVYYVGGEHIETGELKVAGRGIIKEADLGPMFYFGFKPGDILFVTRNPHLRKSAKVDFAGICSEKTLVIASKDERVLLQDYLASVMQSDDFWDFMEENKSGSVNYFVNWSTLADYEFSLPPLSRQRELADLLWAANDLKESYKKAITATDEMLKAKFREMFGEVGDASRRAAESRSECSHGDTKARGFLLTPIGEIGIIFTGSTPSMSNKSYYDSNDICFVKPSDLSYDITNIVASEFYISREAEKVARMFSPGAVLVTCIGATIGKLGVAKIHGTCNQQINVIVPNKDKVETLYIAYSMLALQPQLMRTAASTTVPIMNKREFSKLTIPLPPLSLQREFVAIAERADAAKSALKQSIADIDQVMKGLINGQ